MTTKNNLITLLSTLLTSLINGLTAALNWLSRPDVQEKFTGLLKSFDVTRVARVAIKIGKSFIHWMTDKHGLRQNKPVMIMAGLLLLLILYQQNSGFDLDDLKDSGELLVVARASDTTWYEDKNGPAGPEYDYLASFAEYLGVDLQFQNRDNNQAVLAAVSENEAHLAAGFTRDPWLEQQGYIFGPEYQRVDQQVVCRRNQGKLPRDLQSLAEKELVVVEDSSQEAHLFALQEEFSDLTWDSVEAASVDELLEQVWRKEIDCTIANSNEVKIKRRLYPELQVGFTLQENQSLAWTLSPEWTFLHEAIDAWLQSIERDGTLLILKDRHYASDEFDYVDMRSFIRRIKSRMPRLMPTFQKAAEKYNMPWVLLASQAYQESHWNRRAKSPTGVRGIMMLTLVTAREMGVKSRLDAEQSIMGGARYLSKLEARVPESVKGDDRWWYALAAYNVGMGHVHDARKLAEELDLDPDSWIDFKGVLPLLAQKKYYKELKYGYARGAEPVTYVRRIRNYQNILRAQLVKKGGVHAG